MYIGSVGSGSEWACILGLLAVGLSGHVYWVCWQWVLVGMYIGSVGSGSEWALVSYWILEQAWGL